MKNIFDVIKRNPLWAGIEQSDFEIVTNCMDAKARSYDKDEIILLSGDRTDYIGLVLSGSVQVIKENADGNITILAELAPPELFGEVFACAGIERSPVTVQASDKCEVLSMNYRKVITLCPASCSFHSRLVENMLGIIARKTLMLNQKIEILSQRTTRGKLLAFFDVQRGNAKKFTIPYNREELAHYLCVDRSAMSTELCKLRDDRLIRFRKNEFELLT